MKLTLQLIVVVINNARTEFWDTTPLKHRNFTSFQLLL